MELSPVYFTLSNCANRNLYDFAINFVSVIHKKLPFSDSFFFYIEQIKQCYFDMEKRLFTTPSSVMNVTVYAPLLHVLTSTLNLSLKLFRLISLILLPRAS